MIGAAMGAMLYDFMLFPRMRGLSERLAMLKGSHAPEAESQQDPLPKSWEMAYTETGMVYFIE